jgi:hypothetical protein
MVDQNSPPAGWYADPQTPGAQRYWDGAAWGPPAPPVQSQVVVYQGNGTNGLAIASLVLGIIWIYWIGSILAVIFGHVALNQLGKPDNQQGGRGMAIAGLVLGYIGLAIVALVIVGIALTSANS